MDFVQILAGAVTLGSVFGATVAGFFAQRQKSLVILLRESNKDYKDRVEQLEKDADRLKAQVTDQAKQIVQLKTEKEMPLRELTQLVIDQHTSQIDGINKLAIEIGGLAKEIAKQTKANK